MSTKPPPQGPTELTPEFIERLRQTGIRLDRAGRLWHEGAEIEHAGLRRAILRWLDRREDGRPIIRLDERRYAYIDVEDADLQVVSARWDGDRVFLRLNDDSEEELDYTSLRVGDDQAMYCRVRAGRLTARFTTAAYYALAEGIEPAGAPSPERPAPDAAEAYVLRARGRRFPIRAR